MNIKNIPLFITQPVTASVIEWWKLIHDEHLNINYNCEIRIQHIKSLGFAVITSEVADELCKFIGEKSIIDIGARTGYISAILSSRGVKNISAVDTYKGKYYNLGKPDTIWFNVKNQNAEKLDLSSYDIILLSWPDYNTDFAYNIVSKMNSDQILIYQGESHGGCTGNDKFHEYLDSEFKKMDSNFLDDNHFQFYGLHDWWWLYIKK